MDYPEEDEMTGGLCQVGKLPMIPCLKLAVQVSATLASVRPGCIGDTLVDFTL